MSKSLLIIFFLLASALHTYGTGTSPFHVSKDSIIKTEKKHSPKLATIYSLVLPGLGQAYNRKYWKIPVIYAALGISGWSISTNRHQMKIRQDALKMILDNDSNTTAPDEYTKKPIDVLRAERNRYRTNRDYSIIAFAGFYLLNVVDAAIDAHFYNFNINKPLAMQKQKNWNIYSAKVGNTPAVGFCWRF